MDNTVNETFIDKLIDELVDTKNEVTDLNVQIDRLNRLVDMIFNNVSLGYCGEDLRFTNEQAIFEYLRAINPVRYNAIADNLKIEREVELKKLAEAKAKEAKGKKEA